MFSFTAKLRAQKFLLIMLSLYASNYALASDSETSPPAKAAKSPREIIFHTELKDGKTHWMPENVEIKPGEKVSLLFQHKLESGPDFHGVFIPEFKISAKVMRGKDSRFEVTVPSDVKADSINVGCQFHPAHQPAKLQVQRAPAK